jgi:hypothetical protein
MPEGRAAARSERSGDEIHNSHVHIELDDAKLIK